MHEILKVFDLVDPSPGAGTAGAWLNCKGKEFESISPIDGSVNLAI